MILQLFGESTKTMSKFLGIGWSFVRYGKKARMVVTRGQNNRFGVRADRNSVRTHNRLRLNGLLTRN